MDNTPAFLKNSGENISINSLFRRYMACVYSHQWVSKWVFENLTSSAFHNRFLLPTHVFSQALLTSLHTRFQDNIIPSLFHEQCEGHIVYLPVYTIDDITVGNGISFASDSKKNVNSSNRLPFLPPFISRFVLDHQSQDFLSFVPCLSHQIIVVHALNIKSATQYTFVLPAKDYDWYSLPDDPSFAYESQVTSPQVRNSSASFSGYNPQQSQLNHINKTDVTDRDVTELFETLSMSLNSQAVSTSDSGTTIIPTKSTTVDDLCLISAEQIRKFRKTMYQLFYQRKCSGGRKIDSSSYLIPGYNQTHRLSNVHHLSRLHSDLTRSSIDKQCAYVYYSIVLSVSADAPLLRKSPSTSGSDKMILPRPENDQNPAQQNKHQSGTKCKKSRETILRERRERNRLSAARSNARKQERIESMEKELEMSKTLIQQLKVKQQETLVQNQQLKILVSLLYNTS